jgi:hypothetical protein
LLLVDSCLPSWRLCSHCREAWKTQRTGRSAKSNPRLLRKSDHGRASLTACARHEAAPAFEA